MNGKTHLENQIDQMWTEEESMKYYFGVRILSGLKKEFSNM